MQKKQYRIHDELENSYWWFLGKREYIKSYLPKPNKKFKILDLGCGVGGTSLFLDNWGEVDRVEISPHAFPFLQKKKIKFRKGNIETVDFGRNKYDLICILDVLYHKKIKDIGKILLKANTALKKDGLILIMDCALPFLFSNHDKKMQAGRRFYLSILSKKLEQTNFLILKKSYIYFFLFPFFALNRLINKYVDFPTVNKINRPLNYLLYKICYFESLILKNVSLPIGSSVIILSQKI